MQFFIGGRYRKLASDPLVIVAPLSDYDVDIEEEVKEYSIFNNEKFILLKKWQNIRKVANQVFTAEHINPREIIEVI